MVQGSRHWDRRGPSAGRQVSCLWELEAPCQSPKSTGFLNTMLGAALPVTMVAFKGLCTRVLSVMPRELVAACKTPLAPFPRALVRLLTCRGEERTVSVAAALLSTQLKSPVPSHPASNPFESLSPSYNSWSAWDANNLGLVMYCTEDSSTPDFTTAEILTQPYILFLTKPGNWPLKKP